ncbi:septal ring lytic transglycosylase RlpA family protein [Noviherbaspirillum sp. UKPF54]|uniref:septal ring lytic transglycosylase RlpA family protein n=1 Tax=Noviherbaspirillum sp. UKPF54 TaxID=2601898 RepID=UPI0011B11A70|nr:septal ring lytic transglycosylase RlpA family protein [Noviherbaspirillum sp. UKPF54]QDZ29344.1 septal ring lytic transglycosylase RlpA family protein [Noviherbaspirillum sp. UKPF54]
MRNILPLALLCSCCIAANALAAEAPQPQKQQAKKAATPATDRSGKTRKGKASYYSHKLAGKKMADGTPMNPDANIAASKTLPLGTKAKVTNLENGKSAHVEIRDRGPYVDGRIVDVSPKVARQLDMDEQGVAPVEVKPTELPPKQE